MCLTEYVHKFFFNFAKICLNINGDQNDRSQIKGMFISKNCHDYNFYYIMFIRLSNNARTFRYLTFFKLRIHQLFYSILDFFVNNENSFCDKMFSLFS